MREMKFTTNLYMLVYSPFNHLTRLLARESFIGHYDD